MTSKKPTPKKKSKSSSRAQKTPDTSLRIIDVTGGKLVGRIVRDSPTEFILSYPASLTFPIEALDAGRRFAIKASLMGLVAIDKLYFLPKSAVRGYTPCNDDWLMSVYARFEARAIAGDFRLNPYARPETVQLMQGDGEVEGETVDVTVINSDPAPEAAAPVVAEPAVEAVVAEAVAEPAAGAADA